MLAILVVTVAAGLAIRFGLQNLVNAALLNIWFVIAVAVAFSLHALPRREARLAPVHEWDKALAWSIGAAVWIVLLVVIWLASRRR